MRRRAARERKFGVRASLEAAGIGRAEQLQMLLSHRCGLR